MIERTDELIDLYETLLRLGRREDAVRMIKDDLFREDLLTELREGRLSKDGTKEENRPDRIVSGEKPC